MGVAAGPWYIDDLLTFTANTRRFDTGPGTDADSVPSYRIYEDETGTAILSGSMAKLDDANTVGFYSEQITLSAANGFEVGKSYAIYVSATVNSVTDTVSFNFKVIATPATNTAIADAVLTRQMTESYAANGVAPTLAQAMMAVHQYLMEFAITGTSYTIKQLGGSTAFVVTLNDDTNPTAASRD